LLAGFPVNGAVFDEGQGSIRQQAWENHRPAIFADAIRTKSIGR
jgi:hypothetical protein